MRNEKRKPRFWKKGKEIHVQWGLSAGNDFTCVEDGEWGAYCPLTDEEHIALGYKEITFKEFQKMMESAGFIIEDEFIL